MEIAGFITLKKKQQITDVLTNLFFSRERRFIRYMLGSFAYLLYCKPLWRNSATK